MRRTRGVNKKIQSFFIGLFLTTVVLLSACTERDKVTKFPQDAEDVNSLADVYGFTAFELSIDTQDIKQAISINFQSKKDTTSAKYENMIDGDYLYGNEAMKKLDELFNELAIDSDMEAEDLVKEVASVLEMADYKSLLLGIHFKGHDKKEIQLTK